jgi:hypothetical protein
MMINDVRTTDEIVVEYRKREGDDWFGFESSVFLAYLSADQFREFAKPDADLSDWEAAPLSREAVIGQMRDYMDFAWEKATGHRGISSGRSVQKYGAWLWILKDAELVAFAADDDNYPQYGAPILAAICEKYGFPIPEGSFAENMIAGRPCYPNCEEGCAR